MEQITSPIKAIRAYCLSCVCGNAAEVRRCELTKCPLHAFRFGKNPYWGGGKGKGEELIDEGEEIAETEAFEGISPTT